ncbi:MAG: HAD family hydrolase [Candidatus Eisenbacteria bacterium]
MDRHRARYLRARRAHPGRLGPRVGADASLAPPPRTRRFHRARGEEGLLIRWVFLDMGNVVMNDDPTMGYLYCALDDALRARGMEIPFPELLREREELIRTSGTGHWSILAERYLGREGLNRLMQETARELRANYLAYHNVLPGMAETLAELAGRYRLAIVANQMREAERALEEVDLRRHFAFLALSEVLELYKPDPRLFRWAQHQADSPPEEIVMVGDRVDNDIAPARGLGLRTIWFHPPVTSKGYAPTEPRRRLYFESQERASVSELRPRSETEHPDAEARSAAELLAAIRSLDA